jgi:hypothetical protein
MPSGSHWFNAQALRDAAINTQQLEDDLTTLFAAVSKLRRRIEDFRERL